VPGVVIIIAAIVIVIAALLTANQMYAGRVRTRLHQGIGEDAAEMTEATRDTTAAQFSQSTGRYRRGV
jgi:hypothetical protein